MILQKLRQPASKCSEGLDVPSLERPTGWKMLLEGQQPCLLCCKPPCHSPTALLNQSCRGSTAPISSVPAFFAYFLRSFVPNRSFLPSRSSQSSKEIVYVHVFKDGAASAGSCGPVCVLGSALWLCAESNWHRFVVCEN